MKTPRIVPSVAVALTLTLLMAASARAQSPFPPRDGALAVDASIEISNERLRREYDERLGGLGDLDGLMLVVPSCQPDPEVYLDEALQHYGMAPGPGEMYDDAVVWLVCYDPRFVGIYYSKENRLAAAFDQADVSNAVAGSMGENLANGNLTGALVVGIEGLAAAAPTAAGDQSAAGDQPQDADVPAAAGAETAADESSRLPIVPWLVLAGCGLGGLWLWRREQGARQAAATRTAAAADKALSPRAALDGKLLELDRTLTKDSAAFSRLALAYGTISDQAMLEVSQRHEAMLARLAALKGRVGRLPAPAADAELAVLTDESDALLAYSDEVAREADHVDMLQEKAAVLAVDARKAIAGARLAYAAQLPAVEGVTLPGPDQALAIPSLLADQAESRLSAGDRLTAGRLAEDAATLATRVTELLGRISGLDQRIDEGVALYDRVEVYSEPNWADIRGNGSEAEESLEAALTMLDRILRAAEGAFGGDPAAGFMASLDKVAAELDRAGGLIDAIGERLARLDQARTTAIAALDRLRTAIQEARGFLAQSAVGADVDAAPEGLLDQAAARADAVVGLMGQDRPDWMAVLRTVEEAQQAVARALEEAKAQDAQLDALKAGWDTARQAADTALDRAEHYLSGHQGEIGVESAGGLDQARSARRDAEDAWRRAEAAEDRARAQLLGQATSRAQEARDAADQAYERMAAEVAREDQRRAYIPRPSWVGPTVPIPMDRRSTLPIDPFGQGWGGLGGSGINLPRPSGWGSRPRPSTRPMGGSGGSRTSGTRRGGGVGW